jgi:hypothetical protein
MAADNDRESYETEPRHHASAPKMDWIFLIVIIASVISSYQFFGKSIIFWLSIGVMLGALAAIFSKQSSPAVKVLLLIAVPALIFLFIMFVLPAIPYASIQKTLSLPSAQTATQTATSSFSCLFDYAKCAQQYSYDSSTVPVSSRNTINAVFQTGFIKENQLIDIGVDLSVFNQDFDNLVVDASCYLDNNLITAEPNSFTFQKSASEQSNVLTCTGDYKPAGKLIVKLKARYNAKATLPVGIGQGTDIGKQISSMSYDSPYKLSISFGFNQPLTKAGSYKMPLIIEKQGNALIQNLDLLSISTKKEISISCDDFTGNGISNLDRNALKKYLIDPDKDIYYFKCNLEVNGAQAAASAQTAYIQSEAIYSAEYTYEKELKIIK